MWMDVWIDDGGLLRYLFANLFLRYTVFSPLILIVVLLIVIFIGFVCVLLFVCFCSLIIIIIIVTTVFSATCSYWQLTTI